MYRFPARRYLVQLVDALLHAADGRHRPQSVSVELSEAVLPADLEQRHHRSFLHMETDQIGEWAEPIACTLHSF